MLIISGKAIEPGLGKLFSRLIESQEIIGESHLINLVTGFVAHVDANNGGASVVEFIYDRAGCFGVVGAGVDEDYTPVDQRS